MNTKPDTTTAPLDHPPARQPLNDVVTTPAAYDGSVKEFLAAVSAEINDMHTGDAGVDTKLNALAATIDTKAAEWDGEVSRWSTERERIALSNSITPDPLHSRVERAAEARHAEQGVQHATPAFRDDASKR